MTFNVQHFDLYAPHDSKEKNPIVQYILDHDADIVCLQEYGYLYIDGKPEVHEEFKKKYPYCKTNDIVNVNNYKYHGLACFSKYPITDSWTIPYESENNGSCVYKVDVNGKIITIVNNHLETNRITKKDRAEYAEAFNNIEGARGVKTKVFQLADIARQRLGVAFKIRDGQAKLVKEEIDKSNKYIIACGDLNDPPNSYAAYLIKGNKLRDAFADTGLGFRHTYNENKFYFRIDHIFYSPDLKAYNCMVDNKEKYSDHYPMICYFTFKE
ncbi:MAG: endonuclease/exonuclease/phosphatase family protein [Candidatus Azobacteroides sp.]|nr:endonuclease/exonuclease/phosphatase family protein [Candidatus Azobacteroides sp.]